MISLVRTNCRHRRQQDGVKGIGASIEGDGNNLSVVINRRSGIELVIVRRSHDQVIQVDHQTVPVNEGHRLGYDRTWEITVTHDLIINVDTQGKAAIAPQGSATKRSE